MLPKKTLSYDSGGFESQNIIIKKGLEVINEVLNEIVVMALPVKIVTNTDLRECLSNPEAFIKSELVKKLEPQTILGIKLSKLKLIDQMDLDFGYINKLAKDCSVYLSYLSYYQLKNGKVEINEMAVEKLKDRFSTIAVTLDQLRMIEAHEKAAIALTEFAASLKKAMGSSVQLCMGQQLGEFFIETDGIVLVKDYFYMLHKSDLFDVEHGLNN